MTLTAGSNYFFDGSKLTHVMVWANGGIAYTDTFMPGDKDYDMWAEHARGKSTTLYKEKPMTPTQWKKLTAAQQKQFIMAMLKMPDDLAGRMVRK